LDKWRSITVKTPDVATSTKQFKANIGKAASAEALIKNPGLFRYAMTAFGLGDMIYAKGLMTKVLQQGVAEKTALAHTLHNPKILEFAKAFDYAANGNLTTTSSALVANVVDRYVENSLESSQEKQNPGVALALYFKRTAPSANSVYAILADKKLLTVVQTALGISPRTSAQPIDTQAKLLSAKLKISDFQDPAKLDRFIARFSAMYDTASSDPSGGAGGLNPTIAALFNIVV
jgi:hypothetical protein